jgi:mannan endo-1,4-beta-mannosidase
MPSLLRGLSRALLDPGGPYLFVRLVLAGYAISAVGRLIPVRRKQTAEYRRRPARTAALGATALAVAAAAVAAPYVLGSPATPAPRPTAARPVGHEISQQKYLGVFEPAEELSYNQVTAFGNAVGRQPDIVLDYAGWNESFSLRFAQTLLDHGAEPLIQLEPTGASMSAIAAGDYDGYLRSYARQVRAFGHPVILSFAPEANGSWYTWGWTHTSPATWIAAWRHVVTVMRQQGATNITWLWTLNISFPGSGPVRDYWPGAAYVNWVGIDGYFIRPRATFGSVFERTLRAVRKITRLPVLLSETGAGQVAGQAKVIPGLFAAIKSHDLLGLVWFDKAQYRGLYHQDWRLEGHPAAVAAFRHALASMK